MAGLHDNSDSTNLIVNYIPQTLTDEEFSQMFNSLGPVTSAKIVRDPKTNYSYGYGFVRYESEAHAKQAIAEFTGLQLQNKTIKVSLARAKSDRTKGTNLYIGGLPTTMGEEEVRAHFEPFGELIQVRVIQDKFTGAGRGIGFVLYAEKTQCEAAIKALAGQYLEGGTQPLVIRYTEDSSKRAKPAAGSAIGTLAASGYGRIRDPWTTSPATATAYGSAASLYGAPRKDLYAAHAPVEYPLHLAASAAYEADYEMDPYAASYVDPYGGPMDYTGYPAAMAAKRVPKPMAAAAALDPYGRGRTARRMVSAPYDVAGRGRPMGGGMGAAVPGAEMNEDGHILFVYNIGEEAEEKTLWELFAPYGAVSKVNVIFDHTAVLDNGKKKTKGYGFVTMPNYEEAAGAVADLNGYALTSKPLQVSFKKPK